MTKKSTEPETRFLRMPYVLSDNQIEAAIHHLPDMPPEKAKRALKAIYETFIDMRPGGQYPSDLTPLMIQLLETMAEFQEENGHAPSQLELGRMFGVNRTTIRKRIQALKKKGYIVIKRGKRGYILTKTI